MYAKNEIDYQYLDDVLNAKEETIREISAGALLWLTRYETTKIEINAFKMTANTTN